MSDFKIFRDVVKDKLDHLINTNTILFVTTASKETLKHAYLNGFPIGPVDGPDMKEICNSQVDPETGMMDPRNLYLRESNPMYRERTVHDCSTCLSFIGIVGKVVYYTSDGAIKSKGVRDVKLYYFMDEFENCYASSNMFASYNLTYVPCDSILEKEIKDVTTAPNSDRV
jgi:hypothetical protein